MNDINLVAANAFSRLSQAKAPQIESQLKDAKGSSDRYKIEHSAREFEAILLAQWLQNAEKSFASVPGGDDDSSMPGKDQFQGFAMQSVATAMTQGGGVGIASMIAASLEKSASKPGEKSSDENGKPIAVEKSIPQGTKD